MKERKKEREKQRAESGTLSPYLNGSRFVNGTNTVPPSPSEWTPCACFVLFCSVLFLLVVFTVVVSDSFQSWQRSNHFDSFYRQTHRDVGRSKRAGPIERGETGGIRSFQYAVRGRIQKVENNKLNGRLPTTSRLNLINRRRATGERVAWPNSADKTCGAAVSVVEV